MGLLVAFLLSSIVGQSISVGIGLLVERHTTPYTGLVTFIGCFFVMIWLTWRVAVRVTEPRSRLGPSRVESPQVRDRGKPRNVLLGAYAFADSLWGELALLAFGL